MYPRIALGTVLAAAVVVAASVVAWRVHVSALTARIDAEAATVAAVVNASSADPARIARTLGTPEINAAVFDRSDGARFAFIDGSVAAGPPPQPPGFAPPLGAPPRPRGNRFEALAGDLAHVAPRTIDSGDLSVTLVPSLASLSRWLSAIALTCLAGLAVVAIAGWSLSSSAAKTMASALEERRQAAAEFARFLADAGHELRTPLTILSGYIDILAGSDDDAQARARVVPGMRAATGRMRTLVEKMLLLSRLQSAVSTPQIVDVAGVAEEVVDTMRTRYPQRELVASLDDDARIEIDEDDLYEATRNLVENALRYAPDSPVSIEASARDGVVSVRVSDKGPGIPEQEQPMVFDRFYRGRAHVDAEGSGLGLAIVRRVADRWNGTVELDSDSSGTRVTMRFPRAGAPA